MIVAEKLGKTITEVMELPAWEFTLWLYRFTTPEAELKRMADIEANKARARARGRIID